MHQDRDIRARVARRMGHVALFVAVAVVPVVAVGSPASATPTGALRQCLADHGVTLPAAGSENAQPPRNDETRKALRKARMAHVAVKMPGHSGS